MDDMEQTGWLIEHHYDGPPEWLTLSQPESAFGVCWTKDSNDALCFARRVDAENYVWAHFGGDGPLAITEHRWL